MWQKTLNIRSILFVWIAVLGLAFTTFSFYDFNPKLMFVEITEEMGEDGSDMSEEDGDGEDCFKPVFTSSKIQVQFKSQFLNPITCNRVYATSTGYMLDLIKPPLA